MGAAEHDHHRMMIDDFRRRFLLSLLLTVPILILSPMIQMWLGFEFRFPGDRLLLFAISTVVFFYGGMPFLKGAIGEFSGRSFGMMTLIALAITVAYIFSSAVVFGFPGEDFFWELATLILIMLLGHWIEMKSIAGASKELELLVQLMPADAHLVNGTEVKDVKTETLKENDIILIKPGEK